MGFPSRNLLANARILPSGRYDTRLSILLKSSSFTKNFALTIQNQGESFPKKIQPDLCRDLPLRNRLFKKVCQDTYRHRVQEFHLFNSTVEQKKICPFRKKLECSKEQTPQADRPLAPQVWRGQGGCCGHTYTQADFNTSQRPKGRLVTTCLVDLKCGSIRDLIILGQSCRLAMLELCR